jgi:hypothetical protein
MRSKNSDSNSASDLFVTGIWRVDAKYRFETYLGHLPRILLRIDQLSDIPLRVVIVTNDEGLKKLKIPNLKKINFELLKLDLEDLPETPSVSDPCGLKLGWALPKEKLNQLNRVWLNKIFIMDEISRIKGNGAERITWFDGGFKNFDKKFPIQHLKNFHKIQDQKFYSNRYPNADRIKHQRCSLPHHIHANILSCRVEYIHEFSRLFVKHLARVAEMCGAFDEETILSSIFIDRPEVFGSWDELG